MDGNTISDGNLAMRGALRVRSADMEGFRNSDQIGAYIDVKGFQIHYYEQGQGDPLLLVHGRGQSMDCWSQNVDELAKHFRVILVDMIGWGYSDKPSLEYSIRDYGEFLGAFLDALDIPRTHIGGFAEGGVHVLDFMIRYPERVEKAVLISPGGHYPPLPPDGQAFTHSIHRRTLYLFYQSLQHAETAFIGLF